MSDLLLFSITILVGTIKVKSLMLGHLQTKESLLYFIYRLVDMPKNLIKNCDL